MQTVNRRILLWAVIMMGCMSQIQAYVGCDTTAMNDTFATRGYLPLYVSGQPCSRYYYSTTPIDGLHARRVADSLHASVAVMDDMFENNDVFNELINRGLFFSNGVWLGITDSSTLLTSWRTFHGSSVSFFNWDFGNSEPNNLPSPCSVCGPPGCTGGDIYWCQHGEDCVIMTSNGSWWDVPCQSGPAGAITLRIPLIEVHLCPTVQVPNDTSVCPGHHVKVKAATTDGSPPYNYTWNPVHITTDTATLIAFAPTTYTANVSDVYKCSGYSFYNLKIFGLYTNTTLNQYKGQICIHNLDTFSLFPISPTATYVWNFNGGHDTIITTNSYQVYWDTKGLQSVSVTISDSGCTQTTTSTIDIFRPSADFLILPDTNICPHANLTIVAADTSLPNKQYFWDFGRSNFSGGPNSSPYQVNWDTLGLQPITLITTDNQCFDTLTRLVNVTSTINPKFTVTGLGHCPLSVHTVTYTGNVVPTYKYIWDFGTAVPLTGSGKGPYTLRWNNTGVKYISVKVEDGFCQNTYTDSVTIVPFPIALAGNDTTTCPGMNVKLGAPAIAGYTYSWKPTTNISNSNVAQPVVNFLGNLTGSIVDTVYQLTVTNAGCTATDTVRLHILPQIDNFFFLNPNTICPGDTVNARYSAYSSPTSVYHWQFDSAKILDSISPAEFKLTWLSGATHLVTLQVTDVGACGLPADTLPIFLYPFPLVNAGKDTVICSGGQAILGVVNPDTIAVYEWNPYKNITSINTTTTTFKPITNNSTIPDTFHYVLSAGENGCIVYDTVQVVVLPVASFIPAVTGTTSLCIGDSVRLSDTVPSHIAWGWNTGDSTAAIYISQPGNYGLTAIDALGCEYVSSPVISVSVYPLPSVVLDSALTHQESCVGANDGSLTAHGVGGTPGYSYLWSDSLTNSTINGLSPGTYRVTVTDNHLCTATAGPFAIQAAVLFTITIDSTRNVSCYGRSDGRIFATATGGKRPYHYQWSTGASTTALIGVPIGAYSITVTDTNGCLRDTNASITQPTLISLIIPSVQADYGDQVTLTPFISPNNIYTYAWTPSDGLSCTDCPQPILIPAHDQTYTLFIRDANTGCIDSAKVGVTIDKVKHFYVPNAFSPNDDNQNDTYTIFAKGPVKYYLLKIFDTWGEKVFESVDMEIGWDGMYHGSLMPSGIYVYDMTLKYLDGDVYHRKGSITLIR